jgi:hypothetical protein
MMERREPPQEIQMMLAPRGDLVEIVARGNGGAAQQQQDFSQRKGDPPGFPLVRKPRKMAQQQSHPRPGELPSRRKSRLHRPSGASSRFGAPIESYRSVKAKSSLT